MLSRCLLYHLGEKNVASSEWSGDFNHLHGQTYIFQIIFTVLPGTLATGLIKPASNNHARAWMLNYLVIYSSLSLSNLAFREVFATVSHTWLPGQFLVEFLFCHVYLKSILSIILSTVSPAIPISILLFWASTRTPLTSADSTLELP